MKILKKENSKFIMVTEAKAKSFERKCKFVNWSRKLEFVFFNMTLADSLFIMTHCLSVINMDGIKLELGQMNSFWDKAIFWLRLVGSMLIFIAILVDILELLIISLNISREMYYTIPQYKLEKLKISKESVGQRKEEGIPSQMLQLKQNIDDFVFDNKAEGEAKIIELSDQENNRKKKAIDITQTLQCLNDNPVLSIYALGELILNPNFLNKTILKLNGFFFIMKLSLY